MTRAKKPEPALPRAMFYGKLPLDEDGNLTGPLWDAANMFCSICHAKAGTCSCWTKCTKPGCTRSYEMGTECPNHAMAKKGSV